jgi:hypothetical protein
LEFAAAGADWNRLRYSMIAQATAFFARLDWSWFWWDARIAHHRAQALELLQGFAFTCVQRIIANL